MMKISGVKLHRPEQSACLSFRSWREVTPLERESIPLRFKIKEDLHNSWRPTWDKDADRVWTNILLPLDFLVIVMSEIIYWRTKTVAKLREVFKNRHLDTSGTKLFS